jgi:hypothetical protein
VLVRKDLKDPKGLSVKQEPKEAPDLKETKEIRDTQETQEPTV